MTSPVSHAWDLENALVDLITELRHRGFWLYQWGRSDDPALLAMVRRWSGREIDVILLREDASASGYRTLYFDEQSIFRPEVVSWQYHHKDARWVFRAVYALPEPDKPGAPVHAEVPRPGCRIPDDLPEPLAVRPLGGR